MNKKGFTLAELLGVVIVMGLLVYVVVTPILSQVNKQSSKIDNITKELLYSTVDTYIEQNASKYIKDPNKTYYISVGLLINNGFLDETFLNKYNKDTLSEDTVIKAVNENDAFTYTIMDKSSYNTLGSIEKGLETSTYNFMKGTYYKNNITNGYVLYNNILHKILGRNEDGNIKIMSVENITRLIPGDESQSYSNSYVRTWLNKDYYSSLSDSDYIAKAKWCVDNQATEAAASNCTNTIEDYVGLITTMEVKSLDSITATMFNYAYLTMTQKNNGTFYVVNSSIGLYDAENLFSIRPVVNLLPSTIVLSGTGAMDNPYVLLNDSNDTYVNVKLKDSFLTIGQYIKYNNYNYRIMEVGAGYVKLVMVPDTELATSQFSTSGRFNLLNGVGYLLNTTLRSYFVPGDSSLDLTLTTKTYIGEFTQPSSDYRYTSLSKTNQVNNVVAAPAKMGEILGDAPINCYSSVCYGTYWLLTEDDNLHSYVIDRAAILSHEKNEANSVIPTIYIDNEGIILSGAGTKANPFILGGK